MKQVVDDLVALCRAFGGFERDQICCGTVTVQQCVTLQTLMDGPSEVGPLAERVGNSASAMTRLVDGLVKRGWVDRVRDEDDRRRVRVTLSKDGATEAERLSELTEEIVNAILSGIPKGKRKQVIESLQLLRNAVDAARDGGCC